MRLAGQLQSNTPCVNCIYRAFHLQTSESDIPQLPVVWTAIISKISSFVLGKRLSS
ncbi:hypothetical protein JHK85_057207 [Glycine max]|nr:hypothetical protein JHK85_057207 [Glycine max]